MKIYNSLSRKKETFVPMAPGKISLYVCGMTVYDYCHLGHARVLVIFDMVTRYLRHLGYDVKYIRNITDIDDKIIQRALKNQESIEALTTRYIEAMHEDAAALQVLPPDQEPKATAYVSQMIQLITRLIARDLAYVAENGDVCFSVHRFSSYGALSHKDLDGLRVGARVEIAESKRDPLDFVLWKRAKPNEPSWDSPWGKGRPGWHIECSAMSLDCLGDTFDIHGGGQDLQFPHHENEIAQSEGATQKKFVHTWMHVGYLEINREKMSKSLGNFSTIRAVLAEYPAEVVRYFLLSSQYRRPLNYSAENLMMAQSALERCYLALRDLPMTNPLTDTELEARFHQAMQDDFNTPVALSVIFDGIRDINRLKTAGDLKRAAEIGATVCALGGILGLLQQAPTAFLQQRVSFDTAHIDALILKRQEARQQKDWAMADQIRDALAAMGIAIEDTPDKTIWRLV